MKKYFCLESKETWEREIHDLFANGYVTSNSATRPWCHGKNLETGKIVEHEFRPISNSTLESNPSRTDLALNLASMPTNDLWICGGESRLSLIASERFLLEHTAACGPLVRVVPLRLERIGKLSLEQCKRRWGPFEDEDVIWSEVPLLTQKECSKLSSYHRLECHALLPPGARGAVCCKQCGVVMFEPGNRDWRTDIYGLNLFSFAHQSRFLCTEEFRDAALSSKVDWLDFVPMDIVEIETEFYLRPTDILTGEKRKISK